MEYFELKRLEALERQRLLDELMARPCRARYRVYRAFRKMRGHVFHFSVYQLPRDQNRFRFIAYHAPSSTSYPLVLGLTQLHEFLQLPLPAFGLKTLESSTSSSPYLRTLCARAIARVDWKLDEVEEEKGKPCVPEENSATKKSTTTTMMALTLGSRVGTFGRTLGLLPVTFPSEELEALFQHQRRYEVRAWQSHTEATLDQMDDRFHETQVVAHAQEMAASSERLERLRQELDRQRKALAELEERSRAKTTSTDRLESKPDEPMSKSQLLEQKKLRRQERKDLMNDMKQTQHMMKEIQLSDRRELEKLAEHRKVLEREKDIYRFEREDQLQIRESQFLCPQPNFQRQYAKTCMKMQQPKYMLDEPRGYRFILAQGVAKCYLGLGGTPRWCRYLLRFHHDPEELDRSDSVLSPKEELEPVPLEEDLVSKSPSSSCLRQDNVCQPQWGKGRFEIQLYDPEASSDPLGVSSGMLPVVSFGLADIIAWMKDRYETQLSEHLKGVCTSEEMAQSHEDFWSSRQMLMHQYEQLRLEVGQDPSSRSRLESFQTIARQVKLEGEKDKPFWSVIARTLMARVQTTLESSSEKKKTLSMDATIYSGTCRLLIQQTKPRRYKYFRVKIYQQAQDLTLDFYDPLDQRRASCVHPNSSDFISDFQVATTMKRHLLLQFVLASIEIEIQGTDSRVPAEHHEEQAPPAWKFVFT